VLGIGGICCDAALTSAEVLDRLALVAGAGGLCGARGLTPSVADALEAAIGLVPTEASAQDVRAFRGGSKTATIRGGQRSFELSTVAAVTFYLAVTLSMEAGPLAAAVLDAGSLEDANDDLHIAGEGDRPKQGQFRIAEPFLRHWNPRAVVARNLSLCGRTLLDPPRHAGPTESAGRKPGTDAPPHHPPPT